MEVGTIPELVLLLKDDNADVRAQAAGAVMTYVTVTSCVVSTNSKIDYQPQGQ